MDVSINRGNPGTMTGVREGTAVKMRDDIGFSRLYKSANCVYTYYV